MTAPLPTPGEVAPCRCHRNDAYIAPAHAGHCCFFPATQTCHPDEVATWLIQDRIRRAARGEAT